MIILANLGVEASVLEVQLERIQGIQGIAVAVTPGALLVMVVGQGHIMLIVQGAYISRSPSPDGSTKRIRRARGFSQRYSNARRYHSSDRSPIRRYRYGRSERDRCQNYRRSPRRQRTPPRERTPSRFAGLML